jgi:hypothetical protein
VGADAELVKRHVEALVREASAAKIPTDVLGRLLLQQAVELWKRERGVDDIASELRFAADGLDPDADFEFMRP